MPSLIANSFCVWKSLPFLMYIVYSTTKSFALYPVSVLIVAAVPALAVNDPDSEVVIPTSVPPPDDANVTVSDPALVVIVILLPATSVKVSVVLSATTLL